MEKCGPKSNVLWSKSLRHSWGSSGLLEGPYGPFKFGEESRHPLRSLLRGHDTRSFGPGAFVPNQRSNLSRAQGSPLQGMKEEPLDIAGGSRKSKLNDFLVAEMDFHVCQGLAASLACLWPSPTQRNTGFTDHFGFGEELGRAEHSVFAKPPSMGNWQDS